MLQLIEKREFGTKTTYTGTGNECWGTMDDVEVIILIQALGDAKIAN